MYMPLLYYWARKAGIQESDASDLVQEVFLLLMDKLVDFEYDSRRSFRHWLHTVMRNKWRELRRRKMPQIGGIDVDEAAIPDPNTDREELEHQRHIVACALEILRPEFPASVWQAFEEYVIHGHAPGEVAARLGIKLGTVYGAKSKVLRRLRQELQGLVEWS